MIEWSRLTSDEVGRLDRRLPVIIPLGLIEAHGPHLPLSVDVDCADFFARRIAESTGVILAPMLSYGFADEMREYPGTVGLTADTLAAVITDISSMFCFHKFTRQIYLSGHGANRLPVELAIHRVWEKYPLLRATYWNYWTEAGFSSIHHADKAETEIAIAVGIPAKMDRVRDFAVAKPWYRVRSRFELDPESGGINGKPSEADPNEGRRMRDQIVHVLVEKVAKIIQQEVAQ
jgi:creatinine amidohydrolase